MFNAQLVPENTELITDIIFPEVGDTQVIIPANAIIHQRDIEGMCIASCYYYCTLMNHLLPYFQDLECPLSIILPKIYNHTLVVKL